MAKHILLRVLQNYLGKWIDGITSENLKYGVWRGGGARCENAEA